jgi:predicted amidohydrolase
MNVSIIQSDLQWENKSANFTNLEKLITHINGNTDVVILPEMFNTGFSMRPAELSEPADGETFIWMKSVASTGNFGLCGSYMVSSDGKYYNRWVFVSPGGESWFYDKRHLFSMGEENKYFSVGKSRLIFKFRGIRISPFICYDLRFPVWSRNKNDYDLAIYSANWPEARISVWDTLLKARAIENQCYVAGSNITGTDGNGIKYCGNSVIISPRGEVISFADTNKDCSITADISLEELSDFRNKFPVFNDADDFSLSL